MENQGTATQPQKKGLISRRAWVMILVLSLLATISNPVPGESANYIAGRFIGSLLLFAAVWALVVLVSRWVSRRFGRIA
jgi:uncharacterized membrane protein YccC